MIDRRISTWFIAGSVAMLGGLCLYMIRAYLLPLFFAAVLAVLFRPVFERILALCGDRRRVAATITTLGVVVLVPLPLGILVFFASRGMLSVGEELVVESMNGQTGRWLMIIEQSLNANQLQQFQQGVLSGMTATESLPANGSAAALQAARNLDQRMESEELKQTVTKSSWERLIDGAEENRRIQEALAYVESYLPKRQSATLQENIVGAVQQVGQVVYERTTLIMFNLVEFVIGMAVMLLTLFYLWADTPQLKHAIQRLSPLDKHDQKELYDKFDRVCRGVVLGTLAAAVAQAVLNTIGFAIVGIGHLPLLAMLTLILSMIPFLGAGAVWVPAVIVLALEGRYFAAGFLAVFGALVVSSADNVIRAYFIGGQASIHPLIVFITMLGAIGAIGLWGVFVGPTAAAFLFALLNILVDRLDEKGVSTSRPPVDPC